MSSPDYELEAKGLADQFMAALDALVDLETLKRVTDRFLRKFYDKGIERQEVKWNVNFMRNEDTIKYLQQATYESIKGINDDLKKQLQRELAQGLAAGEGRDQMKKRIASIFRGNNPTRFRFEDRIEMIRRTEIERAENYAAIDSARQLPFPTKKMVKIVDDTRTSDICSAMFRKYGSKRQAIAIDDNFTVTIKQGNKTKTISEMAPPFHPNCRTSVQMVIVEEESD